MPAGGLAQLHSGDHYRGDYRCCCCDRPLAIKPQRVLATKRHIKHKKKSRRGEGMRRVVFVWAVLILSGVAVMGQTAAPAAVLPAECVEMKTRLDRAETRLSDWPALARYREDNQKTAPPAKNDQRVVFMGDSITDSW